MADKAWTKRDSAKMVSAGNPARVRRIDWGGCPLGGPINKPSSERPDHG
jgi:hypothetical protein